MEIYYFSGTGNSRMVALDLAEALDAEPFDIAQAAKEPVLADDQEIGIVFPVYFEALPLAVVDFVRRLHAPKNAYIFAVCTYGGAAGGAAAQLKRELERLGFKLSAAYGVPMPQNSFRKPWENRERLMAGWKKRLPVIAQRTRARKKGRRLFNWPLEALIALLNPVALRPSVRCRLAKLSGLPRGASMARLIHQADRSYAAADACTGCGLCAGVCPAGDISMKDGKPVWNGGCELCTRCYQICPVRAIAGGVVQPGFYYEPVEPYDGVPYRVIKTGFDSAVK